MQDIKVRYPEFQFPENPFRIDIINFCYIFIFSLFFFFLFHRRSTTQQIHNISITLEKSWLLYPLSRGEKGWKQGWPILNHTKSWHNKRSSEGGGGGRVSERGGGCDGRDRRGGRRATRRDPRDGIEQRSFEAAG